VDDILVSIIVVLVVGLAIIALFVIITRKKKQLESDLRQLALSSGWSYEKIDQIHRRGYVLSGEGWHMESVMEGTDRSSEAGSADWSFTNKWRTDRISLPAGLVMIGPRTPNVQAGPFSGLGNLVIQKVLHQMLGEDAHNAADLTEVFVGRTSFRDRYSVWATSREAAEKALTYELENELLNWPMKEVPVIKFNDHGVEVITRPGKLATPEEAQALVAVGKAVLRA